MRFAWVVKVDDKELRLHFVGIEVLQEMIVGYLREVGELVVVDVHRKSLLHLLLDVIVYNRIGLTRTRRAEYHRRTERIDDVDPALVPLFTIVEACGEIHRILVLHQASLLHKTLIF